MAITLLPRLSTKMRLYGIGLPILALALALFLSLARWQWQKAEVKAAAQQQWLIRSQSTESIPDQIIDDVDAWRYRRVKLAGHYEQQGQIMLDNRYYREQGGYEVLTPFRPDHSNIRLWINRGWIKASQNHYDLPKLPPPKGWVELSGRIEAPRQRFFELGHSAPAATPSNGTPLWQNPDFTRINQEALWPMQRFMVLLDANVASGFARDWPMPDERIDKHRSYAWQWLGFALASILIWSSLWWRSR